MGLFKKSNTTTKLATEFAKLVREYEKLPNASKNLVARYLPNAFANNIGRRKNRQKGNRGNRGNKALSNRSSTSSRASSLSSAWSSAWSNNARQPTPNDLTRIFGTANTYQRVRVPTNTSQTRYAPRSTDTRIVN